MTNTIVVTGATGKTGRRVLARLHTQRQDVRPVGRTLPDRFDWNDRSTWTNVTRNADALYLVVPEAIPADVAADLVELARTGGVGHLVLLSARVWEELGRAPVEDAVARIAIPTTILRPTWFLQNFTEERVFADELAAGSMESPAGAGLEPLIDADDIAAVATHMLVNGSAVDRQVIELSGPEPVTFAAVAEQLATARGQRLRTDTISGEAYRRRLRDRGFSTAYADALTGLLTHVSTGASARVSTGVQDVLGRPARSVAEWISTLGTDR